MLEELHVRQICGIAHASLRFRPGLIAITGESGAGKSSLVRALEFLCGKRAQASLLRSDAEEADVRGVFSADALEAIDDIYQPQEGLLVVRRTLGRNAKGRITLQGAPAPLSVLSGIMSSCVAIQSQFAQLTLLEPVRQRDLLDSTGSGDALHLRHALNHHMTELAELRREEAALRQKQKNIEERHEHMEEVMERVRQLHLSPDSETDLNREMEELNLRRARRKQLDEAEKLLLGSAGSLGILGDLEAFCTTLRRLASFQDIENWESLAEEALRSLQRIAASMEKTQGNSNEALEQEQEQLEFRMGTLRRLKRLLHADSVTEILARCQEVDAARSWLVASREEALSLQRRAEALQSVLRQEARDLRSRRQEAAHILELTVNRILADLAMDNAPFRVRLQPLDKIRRDGAEEVSFLLETGNGAWRPVARSASGGELSRILLALQLSLPQERLPKVLIFDEVEAGLGGKAALLAGYKLQELSSRCQVILITHEATLAARASQHFVVFRHSDITAVEEVVSQQRVKEIARMLCGDPSSPDAQLHATTLLREGGNLDPAIVRNFF